jgi:hypothetical protein
VFEYSALPTTTPTEVLLTKMQERATFLLAKCDAANFNTSSKEKKNNDGKNILFILDITGSMSQFINDERKSSKAIVAKKIIEQIIHHLNILSVLFGVTVADTKKNTRNVLNKNIHYLNILLVLFGSD